MDLQRARRTTAALYPNLTPFDMNDAMKEICFFFIKKKVMILFFLEALINRVECFVMYIGSWRRSG